MHIIIPNQKLILASASPRRKDLLEQLNVPFSVVPSNMPEPDYDHGPPEDYVKKLAKSKANHVAGGFPDHWVIAADTVVILDGSFLGKPAQPTDARNMLRRLSGRTHQVFTGFCVCCRQPRRQITRAVKTEVSFRTLTEAEIQWYSSTPEPYDKAGGYGIQGMGAVFIRHINGSWSNVVGLPLCELTEVLLDEHIIAFGQVTE